jgi:hypothetical protein
LTLGTYTHKEIGKLARIVEALPTLDVVGMWDSNGERNLHSHQEDMVHESQRCQDRMAIP